ncbi:MAG TPA: biotin/lipoyl-binding protein [Candidatus Paceibacterota bacterium]|nr:biotin/lipoyl-binding protein [Candidatus Paceibacterota bacterium]
MTIFSKPKRILPIIAVVAAGVGVFLYQKVGVPPTVALPSPTTVTTPWVSGTSIALSFPKGGRIEAVAVGVGQKVYKGETLAQLSAADAQGAVDQARGALALAQAQYASLNAQYATTKAQQDLLVAKAYQTLLSDGLAGSPSDQDPNQLIVSGTYTCGKEGSYVLTPYASNDSNSGFSLHYSGLESGTVGVKYDSPVALGSCGLQIKFTHDASFDAATVWTIAIPNTQAATYLADKNAYDLAVANRDKVLSDLATTIGAGDGKMSVAQAQVAAAEGAYNAALGAYQNTIITAPADGVVTFIATDLKVGQSVGANEPLISITTQ